MSQNNEPEVATFGAGCFWGVESAFMSVPGVLSTAVGYEGGHLPNPTYHDVCTDRTGHAEVVQVTFEPQQVSYETLLKTFFKIHDPTTADRQGPDIGSQYRSVIFYHSEAQAEAARRIKQELDKSGTYNRPLVTEIAPAGEFYAAEEYHQKYFHKRGINPTCHVL